MTIKELIDELKGFDNTLPVQMKMVHNDAEFTMPVHGLIYTTIDKIVIIVGGD